MRVQQSLAISDQLTLPANARYNMMRIDPAALELMREFGSFAQSPHSSKATAYTSERNSPQFQCFFSHRKHLLYHRKLSSSLLNSRGSLINCLFGLYSAKLFRQIILKKRKRDICKNDFSRQISIYLLLFI